MARLRDSYGHLEIDTPPRVDYGISTPRSFGPGPRELPALLHGRLRLLRSRSTSRLLRAIDGLIASRAAALEPDQVRLAGFSAIVASGRATIVPTRLVVRSTAIERACRDHGVQLADEHALVVEPAGRRLAVLGINEAPVPDWLAAPGSYPLERIGWASDDLPADETSTKAAVRLVSRIVASRNQRVAIRDVAELRNLPSRTIATSSSGAALADALVNG